MSDTKGAAIDGSLKKIVRDIAGWDKNTTGDLICRLDEGAVSAHTKAILAILAQEVKRARIEQIKEIRDEWDKWLQFPEDKDEAKISDIVNHCNLLIKDLESGEPE